MVSCRPRTALPAWFARLTSVAAIVVGVAAAAPLAAPPAEAAARRSPRTALRPRPCFIDIERASAERASVDGRDRRLGLLVVPHLHERKTAGAPGIAIGDDADAIHRSIRLEQTADLVLGGAEREVPHKNAFQLRSSAKVSYLTRSDAREEERRPAVHRSGPDRRPFKRPFSLPRRLRPAELVGRGPAAAPASPVRRDARDAGSPDSSATSPGRSAQFLEADLGGVIRPAGP